MSITVVSGRQRWETQIGSGVALALAPLVVPSSPPEFILLSGGWDVLGNQIKGQLRDLQEGAGRLDSITS